MSWTGTKVRHEDGRTGTLRDAGLRGDSRVLTVEHAGQAIGRFRSRSRPVRHTISRSPLPSSSRAWLMKDCPYRCSSRPGSYPR